MNGYSVQDKRFIVDCNVGRLAKWLRLIGYDTVFINHIEDGALVSIALRENRVILTRDTHILERRLVTSGQVQALLIESEQTLEQLRQVIEDCQLDPSKARFSLCNVCNEPLLTKSKDEARGNVPPYVFQTQTRYTYCPRCERFFWPGTHWQRMTELFDRLIVRSRSSHENQSE